MKTLQFKKLQAFILFLAFAISFSLSAQVGGWNPELVKDSKEALNNMIKANPKLKTFKSKAYGYVVFPKVTKAGVGIGGAAGSGVVFKNGSVVGSANLKQASIGFQLGGQQYSEVIFFENKKAFDNFSNGKLKFDAQASAVAIKEGASIDAAYNDGVAVFTKTKGGLMYEASIGGQHFKFKPKK
jgi:lipid-binding SYLF domain-containing protein